MEWISVKDRLPDIDQIVDVWEMPRTQILERNISLKGTEYGNKYHHDTDYHGWRSTNYRFLKEYDNEGEMNCFRQVAEKYNTDLTGGAVYKKLCIENGEVTHWMPLPEPPKSLK